MIKSLYSNIRRSIAMVLLACAATAGGPPGGYASPLTSTIDDETARLIGTSQSGESLSARAMRARAAIGADDFSTAAKIIGDVVARSHIDDYRYFPFDAFVQGIANLNDLEFESHLDAWIAKDDKDSLPLLVRAQYFFQRGWLSRGEGFYSRIQASHRAEFADDMARALSDVDAALRVDDPIPYSYYLKLRIMRGFSATADLQGAFEQAIARYPDYYPLYQITLRALQPKWGGSVDAMYAFVNRYAGGAKAFSPLKLLYLELDRDLLETASTDCWPLWQDREKQSQCVASAMQMMDKKGLEADTEAALQLYDHVDPYGFGAAAGDIMSTILDASGGEAYAGALLEEVATSFHTDTQLRPDEPRPGNYVIDELVAQTWQKQGNYENALAKYRQALQAIADAGFPTDEERDLAKANIYKEMGKALAQSGQQAEMIAYEKAAIALGAGPGEGYRICFGYYKLKEYEAATQACTQAVDDTGDLKARYWRGQVFRDSGKRDDEEKDLTIVAESESGFRTSAAIDLSMIHFDRKDNQGALDLLNKYTYLYDLGANNKEGVAVAYNNRCYAYMQLGQLEEALKDCEASLKYGNIPDAFRKRQDLVKRLEAGHRGL